MSEVRTTFVEAARTPRGLAVLLAALATVSPFSIDTFFPSFPAIAAQFALNTWQILLMAACCGFLRETFDPLRFAPGAAERVGVVVAGYAMTGLFVTALNQRRRNLAEHDPTWRRADDRSAEVGWLLGQDRGVV